MKPDPPLIARPRLAAVATIGMLIIAAITIVAGYAQIAIGAVVWYLSFVLFLLLAKLWRQSNADK